MTTWNDAIGREHRRRPHASMDGKLSERSRRWGFRAAIIASKSAAALAARAHELRAYINVDAIGYGAAAAEKLADSKESGGLGLWAVAVNVSEGSEPSDRSGRYGMRNVRDEMY